MLRLGLSSAHPWRYVTPATVLFVLNLVQTANAAQNGQSEVHSETLLRSTSSWDGELYDSYVAGRPEISIPRITIPPRTTLDWHSHPMPKCCLYSQWAVNPPEKERWKEATLHRWRGDSRNGRHPPQRSYPEMNRLYSSS